MACYNSGVCVVCMSVTPKVLSHVICILTCAAVSYSCGSCKACVTLSSTGVHGTGKLVSLYLALVYVAKSDFSVLDTVSHSDRCTTVVPSPTIPCYFSPLYLLGMKKGFIPPLVDHNLRTTALIDYLQFSSVDKVHRKTRQCSLHFLVEPVNGSQLLPSPQTTAVKGSSCVSLPMLWKDIGYVGLIAGISRAHFLELHQFATGRSVHWKH